MGIKYMYRAFLCLGILLFHFNQIHGQTTYYWVGGSGNWSDLTHWATTSGGTIKQTIVPSQLDNVEFDANSFTAAGQTVTVNQTPYCKNFVWNGVTNNPTFNCTGYDLNIYGAFRAVAGSWTFTQDAKALPIVDSFVVRTNITFNKSGGTFTVGKGVFLNNLTSATSIQASSSTLSITTGDLNISNVNANTVRFGGITITSGSSKVNNCGPATFNLGNMSIPLGSFKVKNWTGTTFQIGTLNITQDSFLIDNWDSGSFSSSAITCNTAKFHIKDWSGTSFTCNSNISTSSSFKIKNWSGTNFQVSGTITLAQDSFLIANWGSGSFSSSTITCNAAKFHIEDWSGASSDFTAGNISTTTGGVKIINWNGRNFSASAITLAQDSFLIDNWDRGNFTANSTITCSNAKFNIKDWSGSGFYCYGNISTSSSFKIKNWIGSTMQITGSISLAQDSFLIDNWDSGNFSSSTINCNAAKFHIKDWSGTSFYCNSNISTSSSFKIKNWTTGSFQAAGSITANQDTFLINQWGGSSFSANNGINCGNARFQLSNWTAGSFSAYSITANVDSVVVRNWNAGNFSTSLAISSSAKGVLFENWNSGNISTAFSHTAADLVLKNVAVATTLTLVTTTDIRKVVFNNAPVNFNASSTSFTIRGDFDLTASGVKYSHSGTLNIYGNTNLTGAATYNHSGTTVFLSTAAGTRIHLNNYTIGNANFSGTGTWTLDNPFRVSGTTTHQAGTLVSNSFRLYFGNIYDATGASAKSLNLTGTDTVYVGYSFRLNSGVTTTLIKDIAVLKMESNVAANHLIDIPGKSLNDVVVNTLSATTTIYDVQFLGTNAIFGNTKIKNNNNFRTYFNASNATFGNVSISYPTANSNLKTIYFNAATTTGNLTVTTAAGLTEMITLLNNTFGNVVLPTSTVWTSTNGRNQTMTGLTLDGNCITPAVIRSSTTAVTTFTDVSGTNSFDFIQMQYVNFTGGATWQASNVISTGTTGLTTMTYVSKTYYWIGNAGNWNDPLHWSLTSGGAAANCVPTLTDSIVFDVNSFSLASQRVTINTNITHRAITVNGVTNNPEIYSLSKTITLTGNLSFVGTASRFTHSSSTLTFQNNVLVNGSNVVWSTNVVSISGDLSIMNATSGSYSFSSGNLTLGDSLIIQGSTLSTFSVGSNLTLTSGSVNIKTSNITNFTISGSIVANNGSFLVQQGAITTFTTQSVTFSKGFRIINSPSGNYNFTLASTSSSNAINLNDSLVIRNSTINTFYLRYYYFNGSFNTYAYHNVNLTAGSFYTNNSNLQNFTGNLINVNNGTIKFENNSAGNYFTRFSCTGEFLIKDSPVNWDVNTSTYQTCSVGGNLTITNSQCTFDTYLAALTVTGNLLLETKKVTWISEYIVTVNGNYSIENSNSMVTVTSNGSLNVRGNFKLHTTCTYSVYQTNFTAPSSGKTIDPAGKIFTQVNFNGNGGVWTMLNDFTCTGDVNHSFGTFISNGYKVDYGLGLNASYTNVLGLNYTGTDTIRSKSYFTLSSSANTTLTIASAVIKINTANNNYNISFNGGGKTFNDVYLFQSGLSFANNITLSGVNTRFEKLYIQLDRNGTVNFSNNTLYYKDVFVNYRSATASTASINISGANTWHDLIVTSPKVLLTTTISAANTFDTLSMPNGTSFTFQSSVTQNWNAFVANGLCDNIPIYKSSSAGTQATLNDLNGGTTMISFINLKDIRVTGGTWNASNVINSGNNTGINITAAPSVTYYWIGGTGSWTDPTHWSLSSGGTASSCIPSQYDDVVFDIFSFSANGQSVTVSGTITVKNMTWTSGVNRNPTFNPTTLNVTGDLKILGQVNINSSTTVNAGGDFILNQNITWSNLAALNFVSDSLNNSVNFGGKSFFCPVLFNSISPAITPQWTLANAFTITNSSSGTVFTKGNFISNGYNVNFGRIFQADLGTALRNLNFAGSAEVRAGYEWRISTNVNTTLNMGTSKLILDYNATYITINFYGGNKTYQEVEILKYTSYNNGNHVNIYDNNTLSILNVRWLNSSDDNLVIHGTQNIGTLNIIEEPNPYYIIEVYVNSNNNQISTFNITKRGSYDTYVYFNGTGQNIANYNATQSGTASLNSNFQTGTLTISNVNITGTSGGTINTTFSGGAHNVGNLNITSAGGSITTNLNGTNAVYGNYTSSTTGSGTNTLNLINALTTADITMQSVNGNSRLISQTGNKTHGKVKITTTGTGIPDPEIYANSTMNRLELSEGFDMLIGANTNLTITTDFVTFSSCAKQSRIIGASQSTSKITKLSGNVNLNYGLLQAHTVTGGAVFNATNTVNTSTTGWTSSAEPPLTYYWIGGSGSWSEISHWSLTSGGVSNGCKIPEPEDNVVFDQNSFTGTNQFVTLNVSATVNNMQWSGALYNPGFGFTSIYSNPVNLTVNGNLVINDQMRWQWVRSYYGYTNYLNLKGSIKLNSNVTWAHDNYVNFNTSLGSFEVDMAGKIFQDNVYFNGATGSQLSLLSNFTVNPVYTTNFTTGKFVSNGYDVDFGKSFLANNASAKELNFSNSNSVRVRELWEVGTSANNVLNMGAATLLMQSSNANNFTFNGGNKTYSDVTVQHDNTANYTIIISGNNIFDDFKVGFINKKDVTINGNNTFVSFTISQNYDPTNNIPLLQVNGNNLFGTFVILSLGVQGPQATFAAANTFGNFISVGRNTRIRFAANITQTLTGPVQVLGTGGQPIYMQSTVDGTRATLTRAEDNMCFDYIWIKDINATGGATYLGGINGVDLGNNLGIIFEDNCAGYYWVGGSGNWSDVNHWATASGGSNKHMVSPTQVDHVYFDANSFTAAGQTVNLDVSGICANMDWLSSLFNPTFAGSADSLKIHGSLTLSPNMNITWQGNWYLKGDTEIETVDLKGKTLTNLSFDANQSTGGYNILQPIVVTDTLIISDGIITTNNQAISTKTFIINSSNTKTLNLGSSSVTINEGSWEVQDNSAITLNSGTSTIDLKSNAGDVIFNGGDLTYNNVKFTTTSTMEGSVFGNNTFNTFTAGGSTHLTLESGKMQTATTFNLSGKCLSNLTIDASVPGTASTLSKSSGTVNSLFLDLTDVHTTGGATFNATFSTNNGNNNGWNFPSTTVLDVNLTANNPTCPVPNNGSIIANIIGGLSPYTYQWSNLAATQTISNLSAGIYSVTITDNAGCSVTKSATITQPSTYGYTASATGSTVCFGTSTGTVSVSAPLGASPLTYLWNNGASSGTQMNVPAGSYAVTVTDANGCLATASTTVNAYPQLTASYSNTTANCKDVAMTFTGLPNTAGYMYGWDFGNGNNAATRVANDTFTATGNYTVVLTVTDLNGCTDTESKQITIVNPPSVTATTVSTTTCISCNGFVNLNISNGTSPYTIVNSTAVSNLCAGNYTYQIRDVNQCLSTQETFTVSLNDLTKPSISGLTNKTAVVNAGCTATGISLGTPVVSDDCSSTANIVVTNNAPVSGIYPIGVTTVIWTATDQAMNVQTFNQNVTVNAADINLIGNSMSIVNGDTIPSVGDNTDFGEINIGDNVSKTFSIQNLGTSTLNLTGSPKVTVSNPTHFSITSQPSAASISSGGAALNFTIKYMPTAAGTHLDSVTILSNDCDETIYRFRIKGKVNCSISIDNVTVGNETCPDENDGSITIDATCLSCASVADIRYSTDNVDFSNSDGVFEDLPDGTYTVYARDVNNVGCNTSSGPHTIAAGVDNQLPSITCPSNINADNDSGLCSAAVNYTAPVGTDNCPMPTTVQTAGMTSGSAFPVGLTVNTFRVTDATGNTAVCSFTVTVSDTLRPVITCPSNINADNDTGLCSAAVNYTTPVGTDNCPLPTTAQIAGLTGGSAFPVGSTVNTFRVTDASGNTAVCSFTVTVTDTLRPMITCPSNINADNDTGLCSAVVNYTVPIGTDNCPMPTTVQTAGMTSGSAFPVGSTVNTFRVTDAAGNTAVCSFTVTVTDTLRPMITCPTNISADNDSGLCSAVVNYTAPVGTDNCPMPMTVQTAGMTSGSAFPVGSTVNTFRVTDAAGNTAVCSFAVTVSDTLRPMITCPSNINADNDIGLCSAVVNYTAPIGTDNCPLPTTAQIAGLTGGSAFPVGSTVNTFRVTDAAGNTAVCSFTVTVSDTLRPVITCPSNINADNDAGLCSAVVNYTTPVGTDNCPMPTTVQTVGMTSGSAFPVGSTVNTFRVTDAAGNTAVCSFTVTVSDTLLPVITCPSNINADNDAGLCSAVVNFTAPIGTDNCPMPTTVQTAGMTSGSAFPVGSAVNTFRVTDASGNTALCSFTVTVSDTLRPVITCPSNINADNDAGLCSAVVNFTAPIGTDNCPMPATVQPAGITSGSAFPVGSTVNTFRVTDAAGNTAVCSFTVTVSDTLRPVIICPTNISADNDSGLCSAAVNYTTPVGTDNCPMPATVQTAGMTSGSAFPVGSTVNTFRVTDAAGNTTVCSFTVTVTDTLLPVITCPSNITVNTDVGLCTASGVSLGSATVSDNCNMSIIPTNNATEPYNRDVNTIIWTANDGNGNIKTCLQSVTVLYPEVNILGNGMAISDGDNTTSISDFTDFGPQAPNTNTDRVFSIQNLGSNPLILSNAPIVTISGDAEFTIHTQPSSTFINAGGVDLSFMVRYSPTSAGNHTAIVTLVNNDCDEEDFTFAVSSCGTSLFYKDQDGDGYGNADSVEVTCNQPLGYVANGDDCNDNYSGLNIQPVIFSHDGICYPTLEAALAVAGGNSGKEVMIHADASPNEINIIPEGVTVRVLSGTWTNHMMLKNNGLIVIESGANFFNATGGVYKGKGVFDGSFQNIGGKVKPGD